MSFHQLLLGENHGMQSLPQSFDGLQRPGKNGLVAIRCDKSRSAEYHVYEDRVLCYIPSALGYGAYYPVHENRLEKPVEAVLMDLDGTTVSSEAFWVWIIEKTMQSLMGDARFAFTEKDIPHVSGHSVSAHLSYCINAYCPDKHLEEAREWYFYHTRREMALIAKGEGRADAFVPVPGVGEFLRALKGRGIKLGLVTSGLYEKAYPEILSAFRTLGFPAPEAFYDCIISAGYPLGKGGWGTLGELSPKPHPWLYAEAGCVGLGIPFEKRGRVVGLEDSAVGIHAIRLAGYTALGVHGGNIEKSGAVPFCDGYFASFRDVLSHIS